MPGADHPLLVSVPLVDPVITRRIGLIRRKGRSLSPAARQIYEFISEMKGQRRAKRPASHAA
jgi:DNA-binding transcriptional LysR family regulator